MMQLLLATHNANKTREFAQLFGPEILIRDLTQIPATGPVAETGSTFEQNATIKAQIVSGLFPNELVLADDSGLDVEALNGPGIFSARYAAEHATDEQNVVKLLSELTNRDRAMDPRHPRPTQAQTARGRALSNKARFCCVLALARRGQVLGTFSGEVRGNIVDKRRGNKGFGYDPVFQPEGFEETFAELAAETKNRISHRARAAEKLRAFLAQMPANDR